MGGLISNLDRTLRRYMPDPFVLTGILTFVVFFMGVGLTQSSFSQMVMYWGDGFWNLTTFTMQVSITLMGGYILGTSKPVLLFLMKISSFAKTPIRGVLICTLLSSLACWLSWGLGIIIGGLLAREVYRACPKVPYAFLTACSYSGFLFWHSGLSGSIPLKVSTPGDLTSELLSHPIPIYDTIFSSMNLIALGILIIIVPMVNLVMLKKVRPQSGESEVPSIKIAENVVGNNRSEKLENSAWMTTAFSVLGFLYIFVLMKEDSFRFDLNLMNMMLILLGVLFHGSPRTFMNASVEAAARVGPIIVLYPFYSGMMAMMQESKVTEIIARAFIEWSTPETFTLFSFYSAGFINLFIPSGGGQWAVQAPIMVQAANTLEVDMAQVSMAIAWGDAWTNLIHPFCTLPLLAIVGLKHKDILGYGLSLLFVSGIVLSFVFLLF